VVPGRTTPKGSPDARLHRCAHAGRGVLAAARIDKEIRAAMRDMANHIEGHSHLDPSYAAHLVGLILSYGSTDEQSVERCARAIREALYVTDPSMNDRVALAQLVLGGQG
jgi:hypothetical protein